METNTLKIQVKKSISQPLSKMDFQSVISEIRVKKLSNQLLNKTRTQLILSIDLQIGTDLQVSGNLIVSGTTTFVNTAIVQTQESMLHLAANNTTGDVLDIGFVGQYNNGANVATGLVRDAGSKNYYLFSNIPYSSVTGNTISNTLFSAANTATLSVTGTSYSDVVRANTSVNTPKVIDWSNLPVNTLAVVV